MIIMLMIMIMIMIIIINVVIIYYYGEDDDDDDDDAVSLQVGSTEARGFGAGWTKSTAQPARSTRRKSALFFEVSWTTSSYNDLQWPTVVDSPKKNPQALGRQSQHLPWGPRGRKSAAI